MSDARSRRGLPLDTDPRWGRFTLRTECPGCGAHLPVDGPAREVECPDCERRVRVPAEVLTDLLGSFEDGWPSQERGTATEGDLTWRWSREALEQPSCPACEGPLSPEEGSSEVPCAGCGAAWPARTPPDWLRAIPSLGWIVGGAPEVPREQPAPAPVALACPSCGAGLTITSRHHRVTPCDRCGSQIHLPDAVWRALHPARVVQPWLGRFHGESRPARERRAAKENAERRAEQARQQAEQRKAEQARANEEAERRAREKAERDAAAEEDRKRREAALEAERNRRSRLTLLPTLLCFAMALGCAFLLGVATLAYGVAHLPGVRIVGMSAHQTRALVDSAVVGALVPVVPVWLASVVVAAWRGRNSVFSIGILSALATGFSLIPFLGPLIGLAVAWLHLTGREPTLSADQKLPLFTGWPLAVLYATVPTYCHLWWAVAGDVLSWL